MKTHRWLWWSVGLIGFFCIGCCSLLWDVTPHSRLQGALDRPSDAKWRKRLSDQIPCGERQVHLQAIFDEINAKAQRQRLYQKAADWLLACDSWHRVFSWLLPLAHHRQSQGKGGPWASVQLLSHLRAEQYDVIHQLKRWLRHKQHWRQRKHSGTSLWRHHKSDQRAAAAIFRWLQKQPKTSSMCSLIMAQYSSWGSPIKREALGYLTAARCGRWRQRLRTALSHPNPHNRSQACALLARHGDGSDLARIAYLAASDPASLRRDHHISYPVREACTAAYKARLAGRPTQPPHR